MLFWRLFRFKFISEEPYVMLMSGLVERDHKLSYGNLVGYTTIVVSAGVLLLPRYNHVELTIKWKYFLLGQWYKDVQYKKTMPPTRPFSGFLPRVKLLEQQYYPPTMISMLSPKRLIQVRNAPALHACTVHDQNFLRTSFGKPTC